MLLEQQTKAAGKIKELNGEYDDVLLKICKG